MTQPSLRALPTGGSVTAGQVGVNVNGTQLTLDQASRTAITNWRQFNVAPNELVRILQTGGDAAMLARVTGGDPSQLLGRVQADGKLFLINPKGILVGQGAIIDTAAFMASTLDVADADFLRGGPLTFQGDSAAGVVNLGKITAREGNVLLLAHTVKNDGEISAARGTVGLGAGTEVYLASPDAPGFVIKSNLGVTAEKTGVDNAGVIAAAQAQLEAAGGSIYDLAINQSGRVQVTGIENRPDGRVLLTAAGGTVGVSGTVTASAANGAGGQILVGGDYQGKNATVANATNTVVTATGVLDASAFAATGRSGRVIVWADENTRFLGALRATGSGGGFAEVSGKQYLEFQPGTKVDLGPGGSLLLDPNSLRIGNFPDENNVTQSAGPPYVFTGFDPQSRLSVSTLESQLAGTNVVLDTSTQFGDIRFESSVTWTTANTLRVTSGNNIVINDGVNLTGTAGKLELRSGRRGFAYEAVNGSFNLTGDILQAGGTIAVDTLTIGQNTAANYAGPVSNPTIYDDPSQSGNATFNGILSVNVLEKDLSANTGNLTATNAANAIGAFRTTGTGGLAGDIDVRDGAGNLNVMLKLPDQWSNRIRVVTSGDLTLEAGTAISFDDFTRDVIFAADGGAFINAAGASAIGANTRHLIYSSTPAATGKGGLGGINVGNHPYDANETFADTVSRFFFTGSAPALPNLTYAANNVSRAYGDANPASFGFTVTGYDSGVTNDVTGAPALSTSATLTSGVGGYAINIAQGTLQSANYGFVFSPGTLTVTPAPVTIGINNATRLYGAANPAFSGTYTTGLKNGDPLAALGTWSFATSATAASNVNSYAITGSTSGASANYAVSFTPGTLSVTPAPLAIVVDNASRLYGASNPSFSATPTGLLNGDSLTQAVPNLALSTSATGSSGVGGYAITGSGTGSNYALSFTPGTLSVAPAPLLVTAGAASRTYGEANPQFTFGTTGLVNGDTDSVVSGLSYGTVATATSGIGDYAVTPSGGSAANYTLSYAPGTLSIGRANLDVTIADLLHPYGRANPAYSLGALTGLKNGDTAAVIRDLTFSTTTPFSSTALPGTHFTITASGTTDNYSLAWSAGLMTIVRAPATIAVNSATKTYGDGFATLVPTYTGFLPVDEETARSNWSFANPDAVRINAGSYPLLFTVLNPALAMSLSALYDIDVQAGTLTVLPATLTVAVNNATRVYGDSNPAFSAQISGFKFNEGATLTPQLEFSTPGTAAANAGNYAITASARTALANYVFDFQPGTLIVTKAALQVKVVDQTRFYGDPNPAFTATFTGLRNSDTADALGLSFATSATITSSIGRYEVTLSGAASPNYEISYLPGRLTIARAPLYVKMPDVTREYGDDNPKVGIADAWGFKNGDTMALLAGVRGTVMYLSGAAAGVYENGIVPNFGEGNEFIGNYVVQPINGVLTIAKAPLALIGKATSIVYGDALPSFFDYQFTGLKRGESASSIPVQTTVPGYFVGAAPGTYAVNFSTDARNYEITSVTSGELLVTRRPYVATALPASSYAGIIPPLSAQGDAPIAGGPQFTLTAHTDATGSTAAGEYLIRPQLVFADATAEADFSRYYDYQERPATLTLTNGPVHTTVLFQTTAITQSKPVQPANESELLVEGPVGTELHLAGTEIDWSPKDEIEVSRRVQAASSGITVGRLPVEEVTDAIVGLNWDDLRKGLATQPESTGYVYNGDSRNIAALGFTLGDEILSFARQTALDGTTGKWGNDGSVRIGVAALLTQYVLNLQESTASLSPEMSRVLHEAAGVYNDEIMPAQVKGMIARLDDGGLTQTLIAEGPGTTEGSTANLLQRIADVSPRAEPDFRNVNFNDDVSRRAAFLAILRVLDRSAGVQK